MNHYLRDAVGVLDTIAAFVFVTALCLLEWLAGFVAGAIEWASRKLDGRER